MKFIIIMASLLISTTALSNPASKEYVDNQIREFVSALQLQMSQQSNMVDQRMTQVFNNLQVQLNQQKSNIETRFNSLFHEIGEIYQGGIIFWLDASKQHGLVAAQIDANHSSLLSWQNGESGDKTTNARANGVYAGLSNTYLIISEQTIDDQDGSFAALAAKQFAIQDDGLSPCDNNHVCYGNWYLPSLYELQLLRNSLYVNGLGNFLNAPYWSSTEHDVSHALAIDFSQGESQVYDKFSQAHVRAIHAF